MAAKKKIFFPKTRLSELAARPGGMLRDDAIDGAMASLEAMRAGSDAEIRKSIGAMENILLTHGAGETLDEAQLIAIQRHADQIVTLAGTFCYPALDAAARSLCDIADGFQRAGMHHREPIAVHVQAMHLMAPGTMLTPEHCEKVLAELGKVTEHFNFGSLGVTGDEDENFAAAAQ